MVGVTIVVFFLFHLLPGDPAQLLAGQYADLEERERIRQELGLDRPLMAQLAHYLNDLSPIGIHENSEAATKKYGYQQLLDLGNKALVIKAPYLRTSFQTYRPVAALLIEHLWGSLWLALPALLVASVGGIFLGLSAAISKGKWIDHLVNLWAVIGFSTPSFVIAIFAALIFGYYLSEYTGLNLTGSLWQIGPDGKEVLQLQNMILPVLALSIRPMALIAQLMRESMLDTLNRDYIVTAKAKGLRRRQIIFKHALRNALNPLITSISGWMGTLLAGTFFVEYIFSWKGLGLRTIQAIQMLDFPVVMGAILTFSAVFILINMIADLLQAWCDPKIELS